MENILKAPKKKSKFKNSQKDLIFYIIMMIWPVLQFLVFYILVNFNSILMAFQKLDINGSVTGWTWQYMERAWTNLLGLGDSNTLANAAVRSLQSYGIGLFIGTPLGLFFSYYIYKKLPFASGFRVILFLPSILGGIVMVTMYKFFVGQVLPNVALELFGTEMKGLLDLTTPNNTRFATIMFFNIWSGFGGGVIMYSNAMSGISQELVDSAHLDGAMGIREFVYITLPGIFPTLSTFLITGVAGIFTNQANIFSFYGLGDAGKSIGTYGHVIYVWTKENLNNYSEYSYLSALGLYMTAVAVPLTYLVKWLLEKFGPSED